MLHIIILNKGFFPEKIKAKADGKDQVVVIASPNGSIPVSAYQNDIFKHIEVKLIPEVEDEDSKEGREMLRISQALLIGELIAGNPEYELYTDDEVLQKSLVASSRESKISSRKTISRKAGKEKTSTSEVKKKKTGTESVPVSKMKTVEEKMPGGKREKLPTAAQIKTFLGAANSSYSKIVMATLKKSNQITFEMNMRMKLAETGLDANECQDLAKNLNDEFGKTLPSS